MSTRALVHGLDGVRRGQPFEVRTTIAHPQETGLRPDGNGQLLPRNLVTHFECRVDGQRVFAAELYPAMAANPHLAFWLRLDQPATLVFEWLGDNGLQHRETRRVTPA